MALHFECAGFPSLKDCPTCRRKHVQHFAISTKNLRPACSGCAASCPMGIASCQHGLCRMLARQVCIPRAVAVRLPFPRGPPHASMGYAACLPGRFASRVQWLCGFLSHEDRLTPAWVMPRACPAGLHPVCSGCAASCPTWTLERAWQRPSSLVSLPQHWMHQVGSGLCVLAGAAPGEKQGLRVCVCVCVLVCACVCLCVLVCACWCCPR